MGDVLAEFESRLPPWTRELLACLTERQRAAFVLREAELSFQDIADHIGVSRDRSRQLYDRAVEKVTQAARRGALSLRTESVIVPHPAPPGTCRAERCSVPPEMYTVLDLPVEDLSAGTRALRGFDSYVMRYVGDLVGKFDDDLLRMKNFGRTSLREVKAALAAVGLHLGMDVGTWSRPCDREQGAQLRSLKEPPE